MLARSLVCDLFLFCFSLSVRIIDRMTCFLCTVYSSCSYWNRYQTIHKRAHFDKLLVRTADFFSFVTLLSFDHFILNSFVADAILSMLFPPFSRQIANEHHALTIVNYHGPSYSMWFVLLFVCLFACFFLLFPSFSFSCFLFSQWKEYLHTLSIACYRFFLSHFYIEISICTQWNLYQSTTENLYDLWQYLHKYKVTDGW